MYCSVAPFPFRLNKHLKVSIASWVYLRYNHHLSFMLSEMFSIWQSPPCLSMSGVLQTTTLPHWALQACSWRVRRQVKKFKKTGSLWLSYESSHTQLVGTKSHAESEDRRRELLSPELWCCLSALPLQSQSRTHWQNMCWQCLMNKWIMLTKEKEEAEEEGR